METEWKDSSQIPNKIETTMNNGSDYLMYVYNSNLPIRKLYAKRSLTITSPSLSHLHQCLNEYSNIRVLIFFGL